MINSGTFNFNPIEAMTADIGINQYKLILNTSLSFVHDPFQILIVLDPLFFAHNGYHRVASILLFSSVNHKWRFGPLGYHC